MDTYQVMAMTIAFRLLGNRQDAEDVVQNSFVKACFNIHTYRSNSKFSTCFYRIVYNTLITAFNKIKTRSEEFRAEEKTLEPNFSASSVIETMERQEQRERIEDTIRQLPESEAVVVFFYYLEEYSVKEISEIMSLTKSNVKIKLFRARKKLQELLK